MVKKNVVCDRTAIGALPIAMANPMTAPYSAISPPCIGARYGCAFTVVARPLHARSHTYTISSWCGHNHLSLARANEGHRPRARDTALVPRTRPRWRLAQVSNRDLLRGRTKGTWTCWLSQAFVPGSSDSSERPLRLVFAKCGEHVHGPVDWGTCVWSRRSTIFVTQR